MLFRSLPPAEDAEKVQRCPVCMGRGLVPNSFYATTSGIGSTTQTYLPEKCRTCNGAGVIILPYPKLQPTAEGAAEIPTAEEFVNKYYNLPQSKIMTVRVGSLIKCLERFATLHAQRLAEKMVEEKLREELIAYDKWLISDDMGINYATTGECIDAYLKTRER